MVTSSAVTKRLDRLVRAQLVTRNVSEDDARSHRIQLTEEGIRVANDLMERHIATEHRLIASLSEQDCRQLAVILRRGVRGCPPKVSMPSTERWLAAWSPRGSIRSSARAISHGSHGAFAVHPGERLQPP
jgi:hypothetical protein